MNAITRMITGAAMAFCLASGAFAQGSTTKTVTTSTSSSEAIHDTLATKRVDTYPTRLLAILDGTKTAFDQSFAFQFADPQVQSALLAAQAALVSAAAPKAVQVTGPSETNK